MDRGGAYATLVVPVTLTRSVLLDTGIPSQGAAPSADATVTLEENQRLGSLDVNLAAGVLTLTPAVAHISQRIGTQVKPLATPATRANPLLAAQLTAPISLSTASYGPLSDHSAPRSVGVLYRPASAPLRLHRGNPDQQLDRCRPWLRNL